LSEIGSSATPSGFRLVYNESSNVDLPAGALNLTR
jgi:hypothetical protein